MQDYQKWQVEFEEVLNKDFPCLSRPTVKNLIHLVFALIMLLRTPRGWYGKISLSGIARTFPSEGTLKSRYKRLHRFLDNSHFKIQDLSPGLTHLAKGKEEGGLLPLAIDQTAIGDVQVLVGSYPIKARAIPIAMTTFEYGNIKKSQNYIEEGFLVKLASSLPKDLRPVWIMDRGYGRASLLKFCRLYNYHYIIRGRRDVTVEYREKEKICRKSLGRLKHRQGKAKRYSGALYQGKSKEKVDIIVYREKGFKEPWFLLVPAFSERLLPTELVIEWYRARMNIETSFRDFKSLLGVRGISLKVRKAERLDRLLAGIVLLYILLLVLGVSELGEELRKKLEIVRHRARHGTRRTLSVLSLALMAITDTFLLNRLNLIKVLVDCLKKLRQNQIFVSPLLR